MVIKNLHFLFETQINGIEIQRKPSNASCIQQKRQGHLIQILDYLKIGVRFLSNQFEEEEGNIMKKVYLDA